MLSGFTLTTSGRRQCRRRPLPGSSSKPHQPSRQAARFKGTSRCSRRSNIVSIRHNKDAFSGLYTRFLCIFRRRGHLVDLVVTDGRSDSCKGMTFSVTDHCRGARLSLLPLVAGLDFGNDAPFANVPLDECLQVKLSARLLDSMLISLILVQLY